MADVKPQCEVVVQDGGRWPHWVRCGRRGGVEINGRHLCTQHATMARKQGTIDVMTGERNHAGLACSTMTVERDDRLVAEARAKLAAKEREFRGREEWRKRAKYKRIATMAIGRLRAAGIEADDLDAYMAAHPDDVPEEG